MLRVCGPAQLGDLAGMMLPHVSSHTLEMWQACLAIDGIALDILGIVGHGQILVIRTEAHGCDEVPLR